MKRYLIICSVILLVANLVLFGYIKNADLSFIKCNKEYNKVYPCNVSNVVLAEIDSDDDAYSMSGSITEAYREEPSDREPSLEEVGRKGDDLKYVGEIFVIINIVLIGTAVLLCLVIANVKTKRQIPASVFSVALVAFLVGSGYAWTRYYRYLSTPGEIVEIHYNAPIIYLYDEQEREATVKLDLNGELTCTYPKYNEETGWVVKTSADGVLTDANGRRYEYLYWEADIDMVPDLSKGFCVRGEDSAAFLEKALSDLGLTDTEANAFIMYWLPQLEENPYNVITFQTETYENAAKLDVDPVPDTVVRVNMVFYGSDEYVEMEEQDLTSMNPSVTEREGFVLVEWGGAKMG